MENLFAQEMANVQNLYGPPSDQVNFVGLDQRPPRRLALLFILFLMLFTMLFTSCSHQNNQNQQGPGVLEGKREMIQWYYPKGKVKGVALVVHGLNLRPSRMNGVAAILQGLGMSVLSLALEGHQGKGDEATMEISAQLWRQQFHKAYGEAGREAQRNRIPLFFVGYSLGGLLGLDYLAAENGQSPNVEKNLISENLGLTRMVLFAPAINLRWYTSLLRPFNLLWPDMMVSSWAPKEYQANERISMKAYGALFNLLQGVEAWNFDRIKLPTLVIMDPRDELVSFHGVKRMAKEHNLINWSFIEIDNSSAPLKERWHHLITDEAAVGESSWKLIKEGIEKHILMGGKK